MLNNFRKSLKELFQINHQAGILRLFLAAALTFVLWSLLAAISASFDPFGSLDLRNILGINSENLAFSLVLDIINSYFSFFSISLILLFLFVAQLSFETIADFHSHLKSFLSNRISRNYLTLCAFSFPKRIKLLFPDDLINSSGNTLQGPLEAVIKPGYALLVKSRADYSVKYKSSNNSENFEVPIAFREKIIDCFNLKPASISFSEENQKLDKSFFVEVAYDYDLAAESENMVKFANMLALFESGSVRKIIESILISETKIALSQYFQNSPEPSAYHLGQVQEEPIDNNKTTPKKLGQNKFSMVLNFNKKFKDQGFKRNRKRPIYLIPSHEIAAMSINHEEKLSPSLKDQINELLATNLQSTFLYLFGMNSIKARIINIHERGLN